MFSRASKLSWQGTGDGVLLQRRRGGGSARERENGGRERSRVTRHPAGTENQKHGAGKAGEVASVRSRVTQRSIRSAPDTRIAVSSSYYALHMMEDIFAVEVVH